MTTVGPDRASCEVLVFREGVLSAVGHDLLLRATAFEIAVDLEAPSASARIDARSLRVVSAFRDGRPLPGALSASDVQEIESTIAAKVLRAQRFPEIGFASTEVRDSAQGSAQPGESRVVRGTLALCGVTREISFVARGEGERRVAEVRIHQPAFGIQPYRAMLGALRVKPDVVVRVAVPADVS